MEIIVERNIPEKVVKICCEGYNVIIINSELSEDEKKNYVEKIKKGGQECQELLRKKTGNIKL